jgi:hypothetical protein
MKKFDFFVHLVLFIFSFILIRHVINTANTYPKGSPENLFGNILGLTLSFAVIVYIIVRFIPKNKKHNQN